MIATISLGFALLQAKPLYFGDYQHVRSLAFSPSGTLYAATNGGLMSLPAKGPGVVFGPAGLIRHRAPSAIYFRGDTLFGTDEENEFEWTDAGFVARPGAPEAPKEVTFSDGTFDVPLRPVWPSATDHPFGPPSESFGSHVSAVAGDRDHLLAAWYRDGVWQWGPSGWSRLPSPPQALTRVTAMAFQQGKIAAASADGTIWMCRDGAWSKKETPNGPLGSLYSLAEFKGKIYAGSFENGISIWDGKTWKLTTTPTLTSGNVREMVVFHGSLYVRITTGEVDRFDGQRWVKNVFPFLLRGPATTLADGGGKLLVGQYGGWSEFDGNRWKHVLKLPALTGQPITALGSYRETVWAGTQRTGVISYTASTGKVAVYDQRQGLADDWVRHLLVDKDGVVAGLH